MLLTEYRIKLPIPMSRYQIAQLYTTIEMSKAYTFANQGVEILENTVSDSPYLPNQIRQKNKMHIQHTVKRYYLPDSLVSSVGLVNCVLRGISFNGGLNMRTTVTAEKGVSGEFTVDTVCKQLESKDKDNVFQLPKDILGKRSVVSIDIVNDTPSDAKHDEDPRKVLGLKNDWQDSLTSESSMIVYKLVLIQNTDKKIESLIMDTLQQTFNLFHRKLVCSQDMWIMKSLEDIRTMEVEMKVILDQKRGQSE